MSNYQTSTIATSGTAATYANTGSSAIVFTCPSGLAATALMFALVTNATNGSGASLSGPPAASGGFSWQTPFTTINPNGGMATNLYYKQVGTDTPGTTTYSFGTTATTRNAGVLQAFTGPWLLNPIDNNGTDLNSNSGTSTTTAVLPSVSSHHIRAAILAGVGWRNGTTGVTGNAVTYGTTGLTQLTSSESGSTGANNNSVATLAWINPKQGALASSNLTLNNSSQYGTFLLALIPTPLGVTVQPIYSNMRTRLSTVM